MQLAAVPLVALLLVLVLLWLLMELPMTLMLEWRV
jgi:hypothetical protein